MSAFRAVSMLVVLLLGVQVTAAAVVNSVDDFQDGSEQGWSHGPQSPQPPQNISDGGIGGVGDSYLEVFSTGTNMAGGRITFFNEEAKWTGNYVAAGIHHITADVNNFGATTLNLRLGFGPTRGAGRWVTDAIELDPGSGWTSVTWSLLPGDLLSLTGSSDPTLDLMNVGELRIIDNVNPAYVGDPTTGEATLGIDNIVATSVPEPVGTSLFAATLAGLAALRRRSSRVAGRRRI